MAFDFSKLNFFNRLDARARVVVLFLVVLGIIILIYLTTTYFLGGSRTVGPSKVAPAPSGLQSVVGGTGATAEYQQALMEANLRREEVAKMTGGSSVSTQINLGPSGSGSCIICSDQNANVKDLLKDWLNKGKIAPDVNDLLSNLANKDVTVDEYAAMLDKLVKDGKLTPDQARALLDVYKKQHTAALLNQTGAVMDGMIKANQLPLGTANELLDAQRKGMSQAEYSSLLQKRVNDGTVSAGTAQALLQQYNKQCMQEAISKHIVAIDKMSQDGGITQDLAKQVVELARKSIPVDMYSAEMDRLVGQGKITPVAAGSLVANYTQVRSACGSAGTLNELVRQAENAAYQEISDLLSAGKISADTAARLSSLIQSNVSLDAYKAAVNQLLQDKKLTPQIAQLKIGDYTKVKQLRDAAQQLSALQANNATAGQYADALKNLVSSGAISPDQAAQLMQEYQTLTTKTSTVPLATGALGELQQKVLQTPTTTTGVAPISPGDFAAAQVATVTETVQDRQARLDAITASMKSQADQLVNSWQPPLMQHKEGTFDSDQGKCDAKTTTGCPTTTTATTETTTGTETTGVGSVATIKAGTIQFAVLDTAINSDYPDSPVMATIVEGKYKGAKLLGKIVTTKGVTGQMDRVTLNFTMMNFDPWPKSKSITAYAIDPDTARTVLASSVDYHYMMRFGAMIATSFLQGYATAITNEGTSTTGIFGTSTTHPELSPSNKLMVGLGQVGQTLGEATQNYINRPPTVRVDSGVSLGILFMTDVS